ncbi:MAG: molybdopterin-binding protein [Bacteroidales bacterium]|jgi:molybdenum cofactor synthesis domain-containing protein|nr:molybdopterin-binding protein [Bacteroidales bacterium]
MNLPVTYETLVVTLSDRAHRGEYEDLSGPRVKERLAEFFSSEGWKCNISLKLIPDDSSTLEELLKSAGNIYNVIITTGGTGIGPRDITVETVKPLLVKEIPGIMEFIRIRYGTEKPNALLSRGVAGIIGNSLIYTLPGSVRAVDEYMDEILKTLRHTIYMQYGIDTHSKDQ